MGRPSKYKEEFCELVVELGKEGKSYTAIAAEIGVVRDTLYDWMDVYPDFSYAMKRSRQEAQEWWEGVLRKQATGEAETGASATAAIFAMKNQFPDDYRDKRELDVDVGVFEIDFMGADDYEVSEIDLGDG
jgi:transposase-like protein